MKKIAVLICALAGAALLAACQSTPVETPSSSSFAVSSQDSRPESHTSSVVSSEAGQFAVSSSVWDSPEGFSDGYAYRMKKIPFQWAKNGSEYHINSLQILGDEHGSYSKTNLLLKERAMRVANQFGFRPYYDEASKTEKPVQLNTDFEVAYRNSEFISVIFRTEYTIGDSAPVSVLDTVNCYLDEKGELPAGQSELTMQSLLVVNDDMAKVLHDAVLTQGTDAVKEYLTLERVQSLLYENPLYFAEKYVVISLPLPAELGGHIELKLNYPELAPFMKMGSIWRNFI